MLKPLRYSADSDNSHDLFQQFLGTLEVKHCKNKLTLSELFLIYFMHIYFYVYRAPPSETETLKMLPARSTIFSYLHSPSVKVTGLSLLQAKQF